MGKDISAAPVSGQGASIRDDAEFLQLVDNVAHWRNYSVRKQKEIDALCTYIDSRPSSGQGAQEQAVPENWSGPANWLRNNYFMHDTIAEVCDAMLAAAPTPPAATPSAARLTDAERLTWLEHAMATNHPSTPHYDEQGMFGHPYLVNGSPMGGGVGFHNCGSSLRDAIDAAMANIAAPSTDTADGAGDTKGGA